MIVIPTTLFKSVHSMNSLNKHVNNNVHAATELITMFKLPSSTMQKQAVHFYMCIYTINEIIAHAQPIRMH